MTIAHLTEEILNGLRVEKSAYSGGDIHVQSPVTGEQIAAVKTQSASDDD